MWLAIASCLLQLVGAGLIDPADYLARNYAEPSGMGLILADSPPLIVSRSLVGALGLIGFLFPTVIYLAVARFAWVLSAGAVFEDRVVHSARLFAWAVMMTGLLGVLLNSAASMVRLPGDRTREIYFMVSTGQMVWLILGLMLVVLVSILARAKLVAEDSASIV